MGRNTPALRSVSLPPHACVAGPAGREVGAGMVGDECRFLRATLSQAAPDSSGRSIVAEGTAVPSARFTPHLRVANAFGIVFRNLSRRTVHYRGLYLLRLTTAGRFALRASAHWAHTSLRRHWAPTSLRCPRGKEPFLWLLPCGNVRPELLPRQAVAGRVNQRLLPPAGRKLSAKQTDGRGICKA